MAPQLKRISGVEIKWFQSDTTMEKELREADARELP